MTLNLNPTHREDLEKSGLNDQTIELMGVYTAPSSEWEKLLGWWPSQGALSLLAFPYPNTDGFCRVKLFPPNVDPDGHKTKYWQPKGSRAHLYILAPVNEFIMNPYNPIYFTEGEKKAARAVQENLLCVGIGGLWNWTDKETGQAIAELDRIAWPDREVTFIPDSDIWTRSDLQKAVYAFGKEIEGRGARFFVTVIPQDRSEKVGLDDFLIRHTVTELEQLKRITLKHSTLQQYEKWWKQWKRNKSRRSTELGNGNKAVVKVSEWLALDRGSNSVVYPLTEMGNADLLVDRHGHELRCSHPSRKWHVWDAKRWRVDDTGEIYRRAKETVKHLDMEASKHSDPAHVRHALRSQSYNKVKAMINLAENDARIAISNKSLDRNAWLLNIVNGTIDLHSGKLRPHDRYDLITKLAPLEFDPAAGCPTWLSFLHRIMAGNDNLIGYLQRAVGYALTGDITEQVFFVLYGTGQNGKSTFINVLLKMLGDYGKQAAPNLLIDKHFESHPTEIADLEGCRFVSSTDCEHIRGFAESLLKQLTGGDRIKARFMRQDFIEFEPTQKYFIAVNNRPSIKGTDYGIWRRIKTIPFTITIPESERDKTLPDKLLAELPGILNWAIQGCLEWQKAGLGTPNEVVDATNEYRDDEDSLGDFLKQWCVVDENVKEQGKMVYQAYSGWCRQNGEFPMTKRDLSKELKRRGFKNQRGTGGSFYWQGFCLNRLVTDLVVKLSEAQRVYDA